MAALEPPVLLRRLRAATLGAGAAMLWCAPALAGSDTDTFAVTATVVASCAVDASDLTFGNYDPVDPVAHDAATSIALTCTSGSTFEVALNPGLGAGATVSVRKMTAGSNTLNYSLYSNAGRTTVWGETTATNTVTGSGTGSSQTLNVYGRIPAGQATPAGSYADTVTVTVTF